jgi:murein DD-endopeptidase MepM/ murein hydrolase activator NlpD
MLNSKQLSAIKMRIQKHRLHKKVADELLDHYAASTELNMIHGLSFYDALDKAFDNLTKEETQHINKQYYQTNTFAMLKKITPPAVLFSCIAFMIFSNIKSQDKPWQSPIKQSDLTRMASGFGYRTHPIYKTKKLHTGVDFIAPSGTPINAVYGGTVTKIERNEKGYGHHIEITHNDSTISRYAHMQDILVIENEQIEIGQQIGTVGSTGTSTAPHLHFEIIKNGKKVNPIKLISFVVEE